MKKTAISANITYIEPISMTNYQACAGLMVAVPGKKAVIDTNLGHEETKTFLDIECPDIGVVTHYHLDHSVWAHELIQLNSAELFIPENDAPYLSSFNYYLSKTIKGSVLIEKWKDFTLRVSRYKELDRYSAYGEGYSFRVGHIRFESLSTPGHSPGHMSFYFPEEGILFSGDMGVDRFGPWYGWPDCDLCDLITSILRLRVLPVKLLLTSHGGIYSTHIIKAWDRTLGVLMDRERWIQEGLDAGLDKKQTVDKGIFFKKAPIVREPMLSFFRLWDENMFDHHLGLIKKGGITKIFPELNALSF